MDSAGQRAALAAAIEREGVSLAWLSQRLLGRNAAYLQQYLTRGTPRLLAEDDRRRLGRFLGLNDDQLGGPSPADDGMVAIARFQLAASAGPGTLVDGEQRSVPYRFDARFLAQLGVRRDAASLIEVRGESMAPTLLDGDTILVDHARRAIGPRGGVFAIRTDGALSVKRLRMIGRDVEIASDNPNYPDRLCDPSELEVIGRVVWVGRSLAAL